MYQKETNIYVIKATPFLDAARNFLSVEEFVYFPKIFSPLTLVVPFISCIYKNITKCGLEVRV